MQIYANGERHRLIFDMDVGSPKLYLSEIPRENPVTPPMLCTILRKYLSDARIAAISQVSFDRAVEFEFAGRDNMNFECTFYLYAELIRKQSNLILCSADKKIITAMYTVDFSMSTERQIMNGLFYTPPVTGEKENPLLETKEGFISGYFAGTA
jgi:predicted ribosome quality control (RQC) complex YloA/Tae2 family protein